MPLDPAAKKSTEESRADDRINSSDELNHLCDLLDITTTQEREQVRNLVISDPLMIKLWAQYGFLNYSAPLKALTEDELDL